MRIRSLASSLALAVSLLAGGGSAGAAPAAVSVRDAPHDVTIFRKARGLPRADRTSIDLRRVSIEPRDGSVRVTVELQSILAGGSVDQMVFMTLRPVAGSGGTGRGEIGFSPQKRGLSYASLDTDGTGTSWESCDPMRARVRRAAAEVLLDVPDRCIPSGPLTVKVVSLTGYFRSDAARPWSRDRLTFPAPVELVAPSGRRPGRAG